MTSIVLVVGLTAGSCLMAAWAYATHPGRVRDLAGSPEEAARPAPAWFLDRLAAAEDLDAPRLWPVWLTGFGVTFGTGWWIGGSGLGFVAVATWAAAPLFAPRWLERRAERRRAEAVPAVLDAVARGLRSGASLTQALDEAAGEPGALKAELTAVVTEARRGVGLAPALDRWAAVRPTGPVRLAVASLAMGAETGGTTARTVEGVAATVRQRLAVAGEARALTSQARISAQVMALAPLGFCAIGAATDPALARFLFVTPLGWLFLVVGVALDLLGAAWMQKLASQ